MGSYVVGRNATLLIDDDLAGPSPVFVGVDVSSSEDVHADVLWSPGGGCFVRLDEPGVGPPLGILRDVAPRPRVISPPVHRRGRFKPKARAAAKKGGR